MADDQPSLGQLIWLVRRELEWAHQTDIDHPLRFEVGTVELDVVVGVSKTTTGGGGLDLKVFGVGGKGEVSRESAGSTATTVHVTLTPTDTRTSEGTYKISAADTEPPPRRTEIVPERSAATNDAQSSLGPAPEEDS